MDGSFFPKKHLGQNFLVDDNISRKIVSHTGFEPGDVVLEIGPGHGALTHPLASALHENGFSKLIAVEIDPQICDRLRKTFQGVDRLDIRNEDFLDVDLSRICRDHQVEHIVIVGNLPYNISSPILFKIIDERRWVKSFVFMIQKEMADRILASPRTKDYGILSVVFQYHCEVSRVHSVGKNAFRPAPKVDSTVLRITFRDSKEAPADYPTFRQIVRTAFNQRRKMIRNSLKEWLPADGQAGPALMKYTTRRPDELTVAEFIDLSNRIHAGQHFPCN